MMMVKHFLLALYGLFGWLTPKRMVAVTRQPAVMRKPPARVAVLYKSDAERARQVVDILELAEHGHIHGRPAPSAQETADAWNILEEIHLPLAGRVRACIELGIALPLCPSGKDVKHWYADACKAADEGIDDVMTAVWKGAGLKAWRLLEDTMAREVVHQLGGLAPIVIHLGGPEAKRETHLRDSTRTREHPRGRVIIRRMYEFGVDGPLQILDRSGTPSRVTVDRSGWTVCEGWVVNGPRGPGKKRPDQDAGGATAENVPPPTMKP